jgi:hypothetical protein
VFFLYRSDLIETVYHGGLDLEQIDLTKTKRTITMSKPAKLGNRQSLSTPAEQRPQQIKNSATSGHNQRQSMQVDD